MDSEDIPLLESEAKRRSRQFRLKLKHNREARQDALGSIRDFAQGGVVVRIGGRVRGELLRFPSRASAERAVNEYYNAAMQTWLERKK